jgi:hypothetical protein
MICRWRPSFCECRSGRGAEIDDVSASIRVTGEVALADGSEQTPESRLTITLADTSLQDVSYVVIGEMTMSTSVGCSRCLHRSTPRMVISSGPPTLTTPSTSARPMSTSEGSRSSPRSADATEPLGCADRSSSGGYQTLRSWFGGPRSER